MAWTRAEQLALTPPGDTDPIAWMEDNIRLGEESAHAGKFRFDLTPHLRFFCRLVCDTGYPLKIVVKKPTQVGFTQAIRNCIDYLNEFDPLPTLFMFPDVNLAKDQVTDRLIPHFKRRGQLMQHHVSPTDMSVTLNYSKIYVTWASNISRLSGRPIGRLFADEVDKNKIPSTHRERDPQGAAENRLRTFGDRQKAVFVSSPSTREGPISREYDACHQKYEWSIPCKNCGEVWAPAWKDVVFPDRWIDEETGEEEPDTEYSARILAEQSARLRCRECQYEHTEPERQQQVRLGEWVALRKLDSPPVSVGLTMTSLGSLFISISKLVSNFIQVKDNPEQLQTFINQELGEVWETVGKTQDIHRIGECREDGYLRGKVPEWASLLIAAADTQRDGFYWTLRAYGRDTRSALVDWGFAVEGFQLRQLLDTEYPVSGQEGLTAKPVVLGIDSRGTSRGTMREESDAHLTEKVLELAKTDRRIRPIVGRGINYASIGKDPIKEHRWQYDIYSRGPTRQRQGKLSSVMRLSLDTQYFKDLLVNLIERGRWLLPIDVTEDFLTHFDSETKIPVKKGAKTYYVWKNLNPRKPNHYWDCEVYSLALAKYFRAEIAPTMLELRNMRQAQQQRARRQRYRDQTESPWVEGFKK